MKILFMQPKTLFILIVTLAVVFMYVKRNQLVSLGVPSVFADTFIFWHDNLEMIYLFAGIIFVIIVGLIVHETDLSKSLDRKFNIPINI
jgi:hypothetical protein